MESWPTNAACCHRDIKPKTIASLMPIRACEGWRFSVCDHGGTDVTCPAGAELGAKKHKLKSHRSARSWGRPRTRSPEQFARAKPLGSSQRHLLRSDGRCTYCLTGEFRLLPTNMIQLLGSRLLIQGSVTEGEIRRCAEDLERVIAKCFEKAPGGTAFRPATPTCGAALLPLSSRVPSAGDPRHSFSGRGIVPC